MNQKIRLEPGAVLLLGILFFSLRMNQIAALLAAVILHEAGHLTALWMMGSPPEGLLFTLSGPVILYQLPNSGWRAAISALSGPLSGLLLFFLLDHRWQICSDMSLILSAVNLLPVLPLDGGRALQAVLNGRIHFLLPVFGFVLPVMIMILGLYFISRGQNGSGFLMFGAWLLFLSCQEQQFDVK